MDGDVKKAFYEELTWPEMRDAVKEERVVLLPTGSIEQHGPHLPIATDILVPSEVCRRVAERIPGDVLVMSTIPYGFNEHHMDFPGTISVEGQDYINYVYDVCRSVARHGFRKILIVNGHGSNLPFLDVASRMVTNNTDALCAVVPYWSLARNVIKEIRESPFPGGMSHACEFETSIVLSTRPELVKKELARKEIGFQGSEFIWWDLSERSPVVFMDWWSRMSTTGVIGDPTKATKEKGEKILEEVVEELTRFVKEFKARRIPPRVDHHQ